MQTELTPPGYEISETHSGWCWEKMVRTHMPKAPFRVEADKGGFPTAAEAEADAIRHASQPEPVEPEETDWNAYQHMAFGRGL